MKRVAIKASDGFASPGARVAAKSLANALDNLVNVMDRYEDFIDNLLDDPSFYDAAIAELQRLKSML